ncbi:MAG: ParB/RepB/Spo0J family partition protein [Defluviitaleaceae bacterium]|nr:ParB/RepB/Spo0J family partition protein [Defluviitaleaceae bacterium]
MLQNIELERIFPHPNNPRSDLGDLSELADSIKATGVLQNLTVVPKDPEQYAKRLGQKKKYEGDYTVIIGHRRSAAARQAGLTEVMCAVVVMDESTQVATMLLENMQRNDLTKYEQAQGMQLLLDYGETIMTISDKTGFSQTTVRSRVKLLALDKEKFKAAEMRGATIADYAELDKVNDPDLKNEVLDSIGTPNFKWTLKTATDKEKNAEKRVELLDWLKTFAVEIEDEDDIGDNCRILRWMYVDTARTLPTDLDTVKYFFHDDGGHIKLLREIPDTETSASNEKAEEEARRRSRSDQLDALANRAYELRRKFVKEFSPKNHSSQVMAFIAHSILQKKHVWNIKNDFALMTGIIFSKDDSENDDVLIAGKIAEAPEKAMFISAYINGMDDDDWSYHDYKCVHTENEELDRIYDFLISIGYEMSDEELALRNGTHELLLAEGEAA